MLLTRLNYRPKPKHANHVRVDYDLGRDYHSSIMKGACTFIPGTLISLSGHLWRGRKKSSFLTGDYTPKRKAKNPSTTHALFSERGAFKAYPPPHTPASLHANQNSRHLQDF